MIDLSFSFTGKCWLWQSKGASWHFITLPKDKSEEIKFFNENHTVKKRGWGSVRVVAKVKGVEWKTSVFPQKEGTYILPIKAAVRKEAKIFADNEVLVTLQIDL